MRIEYSRSIDAAYIYLVETEPGSADYTYPCNVLETGFELNLDFDAQRRLIGIEVHAASKHLPKALLEKAKLIS